jgi:hypothetical protein
MLDRSSSIRLRRRRKRSGNGTQLRPRRRRPRADRLQRAPAVPETRQAREGRDAERLSSVAVRRHERVEEVDLVHVPNPTPAPAGGGRVRRADARRPCPSSPPAVRPSSPCARRRPSTCRPHSTSSSRTQAAPLIISRHAFTSSPSSSTSRASPSRSAATRPSPGELTAGSRRAPLRRPIRPVESDIRERESDCSHGTPWVAARLSAGDRRTGTG